MRDCFCWNSGLRKAAPFLATGVLLWSDTSWALQVPAAGRKQPSAARLVDNNPDCTRRRVFHKAGLLIGTTGLFIPGKASAVAKKGAAEYDMEYYIRDLFGGNAPEGNIQPSAPPPVPPPRTLRGPFLELLLNDGCTPSCAPGQALVQQLQASSATSAAAAAASVSERMNDYRARASRSFAAGAPWKTEHVSDQYYFDLTAYALWRTAGDLIEDYVARDAFARNVGRVIYREARKAGILQQSTQREGDDRTNRLTATVPAMVEILDLFKTSQYCASYRIGGEEKKDQAVGFDEFDDEDLEKGASVNCLVSIYEPANLGASLQITAERSRFSPEFVGSTLSAMWESSGIRASYETYFVDQEYRPNPKDYFPNEQLLQFTLTKMK